MLAPRLFLPIGTSNRLFLAPAALDSACASTITRSFSPAGHRSDGSRSLLKNYLVPGGKPLEDLDLYRPADFGGKVLRLHNARAEELACSLGLVAAQGEVYVQQFG